MDNLIDNNSGYNQPLFQDDDNVDLKRYLSLFISNWYWFAIALFISMTLAYGINRYSEEVYTVSSTLLIQDDQYGNSNPVWGALFRVGIYLKAART